MKEKSITMNLATFMGIFEKHARENGVTDEQELLLQMVEFHNILVKHGMVSKIEPEMEMPGPTQPEPLTLSEILQIDALRLAINIDREQQGKVKFV